MESHGVVLVDSAGRIVFWSHGAELLFGYAASEALGRTLDLIIPEQHRRRHWSGFREAMGGLAGRVGGASTNLPVARKDGTTVTLAARFLALHDTRDHALGAVGIFAAHQS